MNKKLALLGFVVIVSIALILGLVFGLKKTDETDEKDEKDINSTTSTGVGSTTSTGVGSTTSTIGSSTSTGVGSTSSTVGSTTSTVSSNSTGVGSSSNSTTTGLCDMIKNTQLEDISGINSYDFLSRQTQTVNCENKPLNSFGFANNQGTTQYRYNYTCCNNTGGSYEQTPINKETPSNADGGGHIAYLDRHDVDCGTDSVISKFGLARPNGQQIKYNYTCLKSAKPLTCRDVTTPLSYRGDYVTDLDKHLLSCNNDESMSRFKFINRDGYTKMAYQYKCCK